MLGADQGPVGADAVPQLPNTDGRALEALSQAPVMLGDPGSSSYLGSQGHPRALQWPP